MAIGFSNDGIDTKTGGYWQDTSVTKPLSINGQQRYGTAGYYFFNITTPGGIAESNRPTDENLRADLPDYVEKISPHLKSYTSHSHGYLLIDSPHPKRASQVESGLLARKPETPRQSTELLQIKLATTLPTNGFRLGILIANADRAKLTPSSIKLQSSDGNWSRSIIKIPQSMQGIWIFIKIPPEQANQTLTLSATPHDKYPATIGGLIFDNPVEAPKTTIQDIEAVVSTFENSVAIPTKDLEPPRPLKSKKTQPWEHIVGMHLSKKYKQNRLRLEQINKELAQLPSPYEGEPTGTGGFISSWRGSKNSQTSLNFKWEQNVLVDSVALFPLRLFLADEKGLTENAYWPGKIQIESISQEGKITKLATLIQTQQRIKNSLPEFVSFDPVQTQKIRITLTDLPKHTGSELFAGGFSEVCIFSQQANIAPRARIRAYKSREGNRIYSKDFISDGQTPLGLPEVGPRVSGALGISLRPNKRNFGDIPHTIELKFPKPTKIDSVRLDPAAIYKPGQAFPVRFSIELLNQKQQVVQADNSYKTQPLNHLGLNPYISYFEEESISTIRIQIYEANKPSKSASPWVQISEITPMFQGIPIEDECQITTPMGANKQYTRGLIHSGDSPLYWSSESGHDGLTQTGKLLPLRTWAEGLNKRQRLLEEQTELIASQKSYRKNIHAGLLYSVGILLLIITSGATYAILSNRSKARQEIRNTREQIASDLHDDIGSNLGSISMHAEDLLQYVDTPKSQQHIQAIFKLVYESAYGLREVLHTTAPRIGRAQNILVFMEELAELVLPGVTRHIELDGSLSSLLTSPKIRKGLLLYYKEAITNIQTHAQCSHVHITLSRTNNGVELRIEDNGVGMTQQKLEAPSTLRTLKMRANQLDGSLKIHTAENEGTQLILQVTL
jgi:signal transduction histidine kinase